MLRAAQELQENPNGDNGDFDCLPDEIVVMIIRQLPPRDLARLGSTNRYFAGLAKEELKRRLTLHDKPTITQRLLFFRHQRHSLDEDIYEQLPPTEPFCHPAENACLSACVSIGLIALGIYIRDIRPAAIPLEIAGIIGLLASIVFIIKHCRADIAVHHDYQRIGAIQDLESGLIRQLKP